MKKTFAALQKELDDKIDPIFAAHTKKLHERVETIVGILRKKLPITEIFMGNGVWSIHNGPMIATDYDNSETWEAHDQFVNDYIDKITYHRNGNHFRPEISLTNGDLALMVELADILNALTNEPKLTLKDWEFA